MSSSWEGSSLLDLAQRQWHRPIGLLSIIIALLVLETYLLNTAKAPFNIFAFSYIGTILILILLWYYTNRPPRTQKGKVGFVVCIQCSDEQEEKVVREDFIRTLRGVLKAGQVGRTFHFIEIPKHVSESINDIDDAYSLMSKTRSHFLIFGRVRRRKLDGKEYHIIDLDGVVSHKPIPKETSAKLSKEFAELLPRRLQIPKENDLLSFKFTSDWTECVAKYIIGIASFCSSDIDYAERLYTDVHQKLESFSGDFPVFAKLRERLPKRFYEIHISRAKASLKQWRETKEKQAITQLALNLNKIPDEYSKNYEVLLLRSVEAFLNGRRIEEAIGYVKKCKQFDDPIWHFNLAFLKAYKDDLKASIREYRKCADYDISPITLSEVEDFMVWILKEEPDKYQYYYCLGFFNWKIKGDLYQALDDFKEFINRIRDGKFAKEKRLASDWMVEIDTKIKGGRGSPP